MFAAINFDGSNPERSHVERKTPAPFYGNRRCKEMAARRFRRAALFFRQALSLDSQGYP